MTEERENKVTEVIVSSALREWHRRAVSLRERWGQLSWLLKARGWWCESRLSQRERTSSQIFARVAQATSFRLIASHPTTPPRRAGLMFSPTSAVLRVGSNSTTHAFIFSFSVNGGHAPNNDEDPTNAGAHSRY